MLVPIRSLLRSLARRNAARGTRVEVHGLSFAKQRLFIEGARFEVRVDGVMMYEVKDASRVQINQKSLFPDLWSSSELVVTGENSDRLRCRLLSDILPSPLGRSLVLNGWKREPGHYWDPVWTRDPNH